MGSITGFYRGNLGYHDADDFHEKLKAAILRAEEILPEGSSYDELIDSIAGVKTDIHMFYAVDAVLDSALAKARTLGVDDHLCLAVESVRPGILDPNIKMFATAIPSRTNADKVIVAVESASRFGKFAMVAILLGVIVKIIAWVLENGGGKAGEESDVKAFEEKIMEAVDKPSTNKFDDKTVSKMSPLIIEGAKKCASMYADDTTKLTMLVKGAELLDGMLKTHRGLNVLFTAVGAQSGKNPVTSLLNAYVEEGGDDGMLTLFILLLRKYKVLDILYNPQTIGALFKHKKVMAVVAPNRRMPTVTMFNEINRCITTTTGMVVSMRKALAQPTPENILDIFTLTEEFVKANLEGKVHEQSKSNAMYETPFTMRMSEEGYSDGYHPLGNRVLALSEAGSIGKSALTPIYTELGRLSFHDCMDAVGVFLDTAVTQNGPGAKFSDIINIQKNRAKGQKIIIDAYGKDIDKINDREAKELLAKFRSDTGETRMALSHLKNLSGEPVEPLDVIIDHAKTMRSLWETCAALTQCVENHNTASSLMTDMAKVKLK